MNILPVGLTKLPNELLTKINEYRRLMFHERIEKFEKVSRFAMSVRYNQSTYMKYMNCHSEGERPIEGPDIPDFNRDSFILHCMRRSFGSLGDWRPGPDDIPDVDYMKYSEGYKNFLLAICIKYLMGDVMIEKVTAKLDDYIAGRINVEGLDLSSDDEVFDGSG